MASLEDTPDPTGHVVKEQLLVCAARDISVLPGVFDAAKVWFFDYVLAFLYCQGFSYPKRKALCDNMSNMSWSMAATTPLMHLICIQ